MIITNGTVRLNRRLIKTETDDKIEKQDMGIKEENTMAMQ